jgi:DNA repair protein RadD
MTLALLDTAGARSFSLRPYQLDAVESLMRYFEQHAGNPVLSLPTGAGKSVIQAAFIRRVLEQWSRERFLLISHVKELLVQNAQKLESMVPGVSVGVYSAGLGRKDTGYQITVAGIQSVYKHAHKMGDISIAIVDECHLVSKSGDTMYEQFFEDLRRFCPHIRIVGMSATPYRLDSGPLILGEARIFTDIAYTISIKALIEQGYLAPLVSAATKVRADTSGVKMRGGEFIAGDLERAMNKDVITAPALDEVERLCADRKSWLVFCVGVDHAKAVAEALQKRGHACEVVVGETPKTERDRSLQQFKAGKLRALVSVGVLTTGFDAPNADALICLRPTGSPGLWVQMVGRVSRLSPGKPDGLVLDFTNNTRTHGPVDLIDVDGDGNVKTSPLVDCEGCGEEITRRATSCPKCGNVRSRPCPKCEAPVPLGTRECATCGHNWDVAAREANHATKASTAEILSGVDSTMRELVASWSFSRHTKYGKPDSMCVTYDIDKLTVYREWVCFEHTGYASQKAAMWWVRHGGKSPGPTTTTEALGRTAELEMPAEIRVKREGNYWRVGP